MESYRRRELLAELVRAERTLSTTTLNIAEAYGACARAKDPIPEVRFYPLP